MKPSQTIKRNTEDSHPYGFSRLRKEGIEISQDLSGLEWTDYNFHDPGITILEQLCFGLTDLIYRTKFDVADYLCDESGSINMGSLGLHLPQDVFFGRPSTPLDYQKALLGMSRDICDIQMSNGGPGSASGGYGLYKARVRKSSDNQSKALDAEKLIEQTKSNFHSIRNLCEDLHSEVEVVEEIDCVLEAEISIRPGYRAASILAELFYRATGELTKKVNFKSFSEDLKRGESLDNVFDGPLLDRGLIDSQQILHTDNIKNKRLLESAILSASQKIEGIEYVSTLRLNLVDSDPDQQKLSSNAKYRLVEPSSSSDFNTLIVKSSGRQASFSIDEYKAQFETFKFADSSKSFSLAEDSVFSLPQQGTFRNLTSYQSVQNQFPEAYGINQFGVPENYPSERKAQALQLKSYLLLFEQLMSNYLATLGSIKNLFSVRSKGETSYYSGVLHSDEISSLEKVYPKNAELLLDGILGKIDNFVNRKSRLLDYLLALYGEEFSQEQLRNFNFYYSDEELERHILFNKVRLLNRIKYASGDRAAAINIHSEGGSNADPAADGKSIAKGLENVSGLQYRVSIFLGFRHLTPRSLVAEVFRHSLTIGGQEAADSKAGVADSSSSPSAIKLAKELLIDDEEQAEEDVRYYEIVTENCEAFDLFSEGMLSESVLRNGVFESSYNYDEESEELSLIIAAQSNEKSDQANDSTLTLKLVGGIAKNDSSKKERFLRRLLIHLNNECEGMHVLEHILLRPSNFDELRHEIKDKFSNRVSVVFPAWTARCNDPQFQSLAEDTVRSNCPAHIHPEIHWLDFNAMCEFEVLQKGWFTLLQADGRLQSADELDRASRSLVRFLELQKSKTRFSHEHRDGFKKLKEDIDERLAVFVQNLIKRRDELERSSRRVPDKELKYLNAIEFLVEELKRVAVYSVEHMQLMPISCDMDEGDWEFYFSNISLVLPKLFSFQENGDQKNVDHKAHFHEVKTIVEDAILTFMGSGTTVNFHWLVPADIKVFESSYSKWLKLQNGSERGSDEWQKSASKIKELLERLLESSNSTGDIHSWAYVLSDKR